MRLIAITLVLFFSFLGLTYAADLYAARQFASEYAEELKAQQEAAYPNPWLLEAKLRGGRATYKEKAEDIKSDYKTFYPELLLSAATRLENEIEAAFDFGFGHSTTSQETWNVYRIQYQTNDLDFYRFNLKGRVGKVLSFGWDDSFQLTPFLGYGFRLVSFERSNFNILNLVTLRDVVTEKYYIHHADIGLRIAKKLSDKFTISAAATHGFVFYNQADNKILGKVKGDGGYLAEANLNLVYCLNDSWRLVLGGFAEFQDLKGGEKGAVLWPDNTLNIYGGEVGVQYIF